ncbi:MAG: hypothetical protein ACFFCY_11815 [Promethearchaeota archaeon]
MKSQNKCILILSILILEPALFSYFEIFVNDYIEITDSKFNEERIKTSTQQTELITLWNLTYGGDYIDTAQSIIKCTTGGYAITGWTNSSGAGDYDIWVVRLTNNGTLIWNYTYGGIGEDKGFQIIESSSGGFAIVSTYYNTTALYNNNDLYVIRLANDGNIIWNKTYSGPDQNATSIVSDLGRSIVECPNGDFLVAGATLNNAVEQNNGDIWLVRLTPSGNIIWQKRYHNRITDRCYEPHSLVRCKDGGFAIVGYTYNSTTSNDIWLIRIDNNGDPIWNKTIGTSDYDRPEGIVECKNGDFGIIANSKGFGVGLNDAWVIRTDLAGNQLWNQSFGGNSEDGGSQILEMPDDGFAVVGSTHSFDIGGGDLWLLRMDQNGTLLWNHTIGDPYGNGGATFVYEDNNTYICAGSTIRVGVPFQDMWVVKVHINIIPHSNGTPNGDIPWHIWITIVGIIIISVVSVIIIWRYFRKKARVQE